MKLRKILIFLMCIFLHVTQFGCYAISIKEKYGTYFEKTDQGDIIVEKFSENDRQALKSLIMVEGKDFARYWGHGFEAVDSDKLLILDEGLSITIKDSQTKVLGQIILTEGSSPNQLNVGYWIGKDFRRNGYAFLAICTVISRIWQVNNSTVFEFWIDDDNISSIKTLEKACKYLDIVLEKGETHTVEWKAEKANHISGMYNTNFYYDGILTFSSRLRKKNY